jgi:hypothetical protein
MYRLFVIAELKDLKGDIKDVGLKLDDIRQDIFQLKTKAAVIGALAGALVFCLSKLLDFLSGHRL